MGTETKPTLVSKTMIINFLTAVSGIVLFFIPATKPFFTPEVLASIAFILMPIVNMVLRKYFTKTKLV